MLKTLRKALVEAFKTLLIDENERNNAMMINFYAIQVEEGWITLAQVPRKYRAKVKELLELAHAGLGENEKEG